MNLCEYFAAPFSVRLATSALSRQCDDQWEEGEQKCASNGRLCRSLTAKYSGPLDIGRHPNKNIMEIITKMPNKNSFLDYQVGRMVSRPQKEALYADPRRENKVTGEQVFIADVPQYDGADGRVVTSYKKEVQTVEVFELLGHGSTIQSARIMALPKIKAIEQEEQQNSETSEN